LKVFIYKTTLADKVEVEYLANLPLCARCLIFKRNFQSFQKKVFKKFNKAKKKFKKLDFQKNLA
jgi:hypothetical protein